MTGSESEQDWRATDNDPPGVDIEIANPSRRTELDNRQRAEDALRMNEAYMAQAQQVACLGSWAYRPSGIREYLSDEFLRMYGFDPAKKHPTDQELFAMLHPEDRRGAEEAVAQMYKNGQVLDIKFRILRPDGQLRFIRDRGAAFIEKGVIIRFAGVVLDITEQEQRTEELRRSEFYLKEAQRLSHSGSWSFTPSGICDYWSRELYDITGFDPTLGIPTIPQFLTRRVHPDDQDYLTEVIETMVANGQPAEAKYRLIHPERGIRFIHSVGEPLHEHGVVSRFVGTTLDITEHARLAQEVQRREAYLSHAQALSHTGSFGWNLVSGKIIWSQETYRIFGYDPSAIEPTVEAILKRVHPEDIDAVRQTIGQVSRLRRDFDLEHRLAMPDGSIKHVHVIGRAGEGESGKTELVGSVMDVTEQYNAKKAIENAFDEIKNLKDGLYRENVALKEEIDQASMFEEIIGSSKSLKRVLVNVVKVAPTDSTVLITGETGTGKELVARAIHKRSRRAGRAFGRVNCAAIAPSLIASELFGHEKGAFTGAIQRRQGRFELAEGGTIFLDEIGELPEETQLALLRVLQEREIERVGGSQTLSVDVRVIAATNRDLQAAIEEGTFRLDLFYRLNVFPIAVPPLRDRRDDIPSLVRTFVRELSKSMAKAVDSVPQATMDALQNYQWPGNIRELRNVIERGMIISRGHKLHVELPEKIAAEDPTPSKYAGRRAETLEEVERRHILEVLDQVRWKIGGKDGAASRLGLTRTTLQGRMRKLGIRRPQ